VRRGAANKRWWAWMALVAVWLTVLAPTTSRTLAALAVPDHPPGCEAMAEGHHHHEGHQDNAAHLTHDDEACAYCTLFAQQPAVGGTFFMGSVLPMAAPAPVARLAVDARPARPITHAPARGPPSVAFA